MRADALTKPDGCDRCNNSGLFSLWPHQSNNGLKACGNLSQVYLDPAARAAIFTYHSDRSGGEITSKRYTFQSGDRKRKKKPKWANFTQNDSRIISKFKCRI